MKSIFSLAIGFVLLASCSSVNKIYKAQPYDFPSPVNTESRDIEVQEKKTYAFPEEGVFVSNEFAGARLNSFENVTENLYHAKISAENTPINDSPWYAFKMWTGGEQEEILIKLDYLTSKHRYAPKMSINGKNWTLLDSSNYIISQDKSAVLLDLTIPAQDTLWISAQELITSEDVNKWSIKMGQHKYVEHSVIGQSPGGRDINFFEIGAGKPKNKPALIFFSRQHPPEVTGFYALQAFLDELISGEYADEFLRKYRILVYPTINPDGVDMGHWRHNSGGVDLNRDWAYYNQPEVKLVANHAVNTIKQNKNEVVLGLDFHSTWEDVYYTLPSENYTTNAGSFREKWFAAIEKALGNGYKINEKASNLGGPVSKGWFYTQFGAEGITYEIGDSTPREFITKKGAISAKEMMKVLLNE